MRVRFHDRVDEFAAQAAALYRRDPVLHTVELTLLRGGPLPGADAPLLVTVWGDGAVVGAAMQTPPFPLLCSGLPSAAVAAVATELRTRRIGLDAVRGLRSTALEFAQRFSGSGYVVAMEERLYRLGELRTPTQVPGSVRPAGPADTELLIDWQCAFFVEAFGGQPDHNSAGAALDSAAVNGDAHLLWTVGGQPVSLAGVRAPAAGVSRIGPVFTPVAQRGHGYGSAVTAAAARWAAGAGAAQVVLFTDLANPVSNAIYRRIGFEPVADTAQVRLLTS